VQEQGAAETEEFMAVAVHDLRNPIAVMRASAQMAQRQINRGDTDGAQHRLKSIVEQTDRLTEMLETFLDAARIGTGQLPLRTERLDLREVAQLAADRARVLVGEPAQRTVEFDIPEGCIGAWDRARIVRAVRALLSNALQYGDPSKPALAEATREADRVRLVISGGGLGPDEDEQRHLFERFYRGRSAAEAGQSGSGLGLFTARGIARLHGGEVRRIDGDRFEIELPLLGD
jgi:two-component system phosphate regulon sensor histidine kinase PhoR